MTNFATKPGKPQFTPKEWHLIRELRTPLQVQRYLMTIRYNRETAGPTCMSFRSVIRKNLAHCLEGALVAAVILEQHDYPPWLVSIESQDKLDHVLFMFREGGRYGAVARSRDVGLHGRKPVFRTVRDLVMSYYDAYIDGSGRITGYGATSLYELGDYDWRFSERNMRKVETHLQQMPHREIAGSEVRYLRALRRYERFRVEHPTGAPDYFANKSQWLR